VNCWTKHKRLDFKFWLRPTKTYAISQKLAHRSLATVVLGQGRWALTKHHAAKVVAAITAAKPGSYAEVLLKAARSFGIGRIRLFVSVILPSAAPAIFAGLRLAAGYAFIMLVAAEMMGASSGLGWLVLSAQESYHVPHIFAGATVITCLALGLDGVLKWIETQVAPGREGPPETYVGESLVVPRLLAGERAVSVRGSRRESCS